MELREVLNMPTTEDLVNYIITIRIDDGKKRLYFTKRKGRIKAKDWSHFVNNPNVGEEYSKLNQEKLNEEFVKFIVKTINMAMDDIYMEIEQNKVIRVWDDVGKIKIFSTDMIKEVFPNIYSEQGEIIWIEALNK